MLRTAIDEALTVLLEGNPTPAMSRANRGLARTGIDRHGEVEELVRSGYTILAPSPRMAPTINAGIVAALVDGYVARGENAMADEWRSKLLEYR